MGTRLTRSLLAAVALAPLAGLTSCRGMEYSVRECFFGRHERDILVERVEEARDDYEACASKAGDVREHITSIEEVAEDLFAEWRGEIGEIQDPTIRSRSSQSLNASRYRYAELLGAMQKAPRGKDPVFTAFKCRVLFLERSLNAQAIASLQGELSSIKGDVARLIEDMQASNCEADDFIPSMKS